MSFATVRTNVALAACSAVLVLSLVGCSSDSSTSGTDTTGTTTTGTDTTGLDGEALARAKCVQCHSFDRVERASKDAAGWESTINFMIRQGLNVTEEEKQAILDYLSNR